MCDTFLMHHSSILLKHICRKMISPLKLHNSSILDMCPQKILEKLHLDTHMTVLLKCLSFIFIFLTFAISVVGLFYHSLVWFVVQVQNIGKNTFLFSFCLLYDKLFIVFFSPSLNILWHGGVVTLSRHWLRDCCRYSKILIIELGCF